MTDRERAHRKRPSIGPQSSFYRSLDLNAAYPIRLSRFREGMSLVPAIAFYNVGNFSNFTDYSNGTLANTTTGNSIDLLNGPNGFDAHDYVRPHPRAFNEHSTACL